MPVYSPIRRWMDSAEKARTAERLLALRQKLSAEINDRVGRNSLLIATWNLRDFDTNRLGHGPRLRESFYYIAEIVSAFDLVVLQEVGRNLDALELLMSILGESWDYFATGAVETRSGAEERMAFVFRQDKIRFRKVAGEVVLPGGQMTVPQGTDGDAREGQPLQFVRAPFMAAFEAGTVRLNFCVLHLRHSRGGKDAGLEGRHSAELDALARFFREKQDREREDYILIGDFGVAAPPGRMKALERQGFDVPEALTTKRAYLTGEKFYDQIAFRIRKDRLEPGNAGTFRHFDAVFRDNEADFEAYQELMPENHANDLWNGGPRGYYTQLWRTWQISDHQPLWVELKVDFSDHYLDMIRKGTGAGG
jgi:endonuclease/exonuclease/phosphatase family metal-dependent hydrolase